MENIKTIFAVVTIPIWLPIALITMPWWGPKLKKLLDEMEEELIYRGF